MNQKELDEEHTYLLSVVQAFQLYEEFGKQWVVYQLSMFKSLKEEDKKLLPNYHQKWNLILCGLHANQMIFDAIIRNQEDIITHLHFPILSEEQKHNLILSISDNERNELCQKLDKVRSMLTHLYRDWSIEGINERKLCYEPILHRLKELYQDNRNNIKILVPGAGLGRLAYEIASLGFQCEGNEFTYYMLLTSEFLLNGIERIGQFKIFPWIMETCNLLSFNDQASVATIPDIVPNLGNHQMSMVAGDFVEIYSKQKESFDCIVTCFFIDTAHNIIDYLRIIYSCLKLHGRWINEGPLLYHYKDSDSLSIELNWEEIKYIISSLGFTIISERLIPCTYCYSEHSLLQSKYTAIWFEAIKN
ncbi:hypothetical protein EHI8A_104230 [Entamoeba histolytica HM-1:IMSS-B]|uniref:carnosine N-methyltransferase n=7 Tax=Entamoeba histolytica TaxID=5759 RepID=C4LTI7_ENTH1|nr:hypothetical protein EHI_011930 [Entamoeba histolytica HM-1:IMSS]EMD44982.1 Hypothetical protein EHI5A_117600 [Entamoeba histolytica KU27]EMH77328.1 hypothetical protein EHI8A_104230 [Entamoeba histolytica HM-1:IMSS-B]EMS11757.1 hypothetical protein KM1_152940 [Entamoeba histolytica HM-3:IMSS]ENY63945.1 hypothetical protein EHI7A_097860 [Entamoeba histolytica HM-1:IMSS-A]GAT91880.1 hypothetical protein CL6EHI_011930 [Entamoeba histolytica]|eukprot:XP_653791.1 hypothetical protein EHI_011930 [Entamoeba histolytica HM-1:IMSS]